MIEQINALEQKVKKISQPESLGLPSETNVRKRKPYTSIKSDEE